MTIAMAWPKVKLVLNDLKKNSHMDPVIDLEILITGNSQRVKNLTLHIFKYLNLLYNLYFFWEHLYISV